MGKILEEAKFYVDHYLPDKVAAYFLAPFRTIESEIDQLRQMVERNVKRVAGYEVRFKGIESRIEALEDCAHTPSEKELKEAVPTDKFGKPPGGLEPGDVISLEDDGTKDYGIYHSTEKNGGIRRTWAYWQTGGKYFIKSPSFTTYQVTFEFRPRFPDRKER